MMMMMMMRQPQPTTTTTACAIRWTTYHATQPMHRCWSSNHNYHSLLHHHHRRQQSQPPPHHPIPPPPLPSSRYVSSHTIHHHNNGCTASTLSLQGSTTLQFQNVLIVIKQTAYEEYSQVGNHVINEFTCIHTYIYIYVYMQTHTHILDHSSLLFYLLLFLLFVKIYIFILRPTKSTIQTNKNTQYTVEIAWTGSQGLTMETSGTTLSGPQVVCDRSTGPIATTSRQFFLCQSGGIGSTTFGPCRFGDCGGWGWDGPQCRSFPRSWDDTTPRDQFRSEHIQ